MYDAKKNPKVCIAMCQYFLFGLSCISQPPLYSFAVHTHISKFCLQVTIKSNWILFGPESSLQTPTIVLLPVATVSHHQSSPRQIVKCCLVFFQRSVCSEMYTLLLVSWLLPLANHFSLSEPLFLHLQNGSDNICLSRLIWRQNEVMWRLYDICSTAPTVVKVPAF